jgi:hypothetical protein
MSRLVIKDLPESVELDRAAMTAIVGGARTGGRFFGAVAQAWPAGGANPAASRVIDYPKGFAAAAQPANDPRIPAKSLLRR